MFVVVVKMNAPTLVLADEVADRQRPAHQLDVVERLIEDGRVLQTGFSPNAASAWL